MSPTTLQARIYHTTEAADAVSHYRFTKTLAPNSLQEIGTFPIEVARAEPAPGGDPPPLETQQAVIGAVMETIFDELNERPSDAAKWAQDYRAAGNRSLSVGDVVSVGETAWVVAPMGYERVSADDLATAIADRDQLGHQDQSLTAEDRQWAQQMAERLRVRRPSEPANYLER